jgi:PAS domain S-box-containing protein
MEFLNAFFYSDYMPHGHCYLWQPSILWLSVISDLLIAVAYFSIPVALIMFVRKRKGFQFKGVFVLFAAFILLCGITHLFSIYTIWYGAYGVHALLKFMTAVVSIVTAVVVFRSIKPALAIPTPTENQSMQKELAQHEFEILELERQKKNDAFFKAATNFMPMGVLVVDANERIVMTNASLDSIFNYSDGELMGRELSCLIPGSLQDKHHSLFKSFITGDETEHLMADGRIVNGLCKDGSTIPVEVSLVSQVINDETYVFASVVDVDRYVGNLDLSFERNSRLARAVNAADEGVWELHVQSNEVWYSPRLLELIGKNAEEPYGYSDWFQHIHPEDRQKVEEAMNEHFARGCDYEVLYRGLGESGKYEWFLTRGDTQFDQDSTPLIMSGTLSNVNQRIRLAEQLKTQEEKVEQLEIDFSNTFQLAAVGIAHVGLDGRWIRVNSRLCKILGYTRDELLEATFQDITYPEDLNQDLENVTSLIDGKADSYSMEKRYIRKDGNMIWAYLTVSMVRNAEEPEENYFISVIEDISHLKAIEQELSDSNQSLERFAYSASHDMQEPLRKIAMFSDRLNMRLADKFADEPDAKYELERITDAALRMRAMITSLMELSRASKDALAMEEVTLSRIVKSVQEQCSRLIEESNASIELKHDGIIYVDEPALLIVLQNLMINAIRYAKPEIAPKIEVELIDVGQEIELRVKDNGVGINMNQSMNIFEPFCRLADKSIPGSGMGLAICKRIIERHGGTIHLESELGEGSTFILRLPQGGKK